MVATISYKRTAPRIIHHGSVVPISVQTWIYKLFHCSTFWRFKSNFECPGCKKCYRCYWDGSDTLEGRDYCDSCAER